jgi:NAD+ kinase
VAGDAPGRTPDEFDPRNPPEQAVLLTDLVVEAAAADREVARPERDAVAAALGERDDGEGMRHTGGWPSCPLDGARTTPFLRPGGEAVADERSRPRRGGPVRLGVQGDAAPVADAVATVGAGSTVELVDVAGTVGEGDDDGDGDGDSGPPGAGGKGETEAELEPEEGPRTGAGLDALVAVGEAALAALAAAPPAVPVLPVLEDGGHHAASVDDLAAALGALLADEHRTVAHPVLSARVGDASANALLDVTLMTSEPARISEYAVHAADEPIDAVRADGVVVATPVGSTGYARDAGGPLLGPGTGVCVVPVAPFATRSDSWVVAPPVRLSVERDDGPVALYADGREVRPLGHGDAVAVDVAARVELVHVPATGGSA